MVSAANSKGWSIRYDVRELPTGGKIAAGLAGVLQPVNLWSGGEELDELVALVITIGDEQVGFDEMDRVVPRGRLESFHGAMWSATAPEDAEVVIVIERAEVIYVAVEEVFSELPDCLSEKLAMKTCKGIIGDSGFSGGFVDSRAGSNER